MRRHDGYFGRRHRANEEKHGRRIEHKVQMGEETRICPQAVCPPHSRNRNRNTKHNQSSIHNVHFIKTPNPTLPRPCAYLVAFVLVAAAVVVIVIFHFDFIAHDYTSPDLVIGSRLRSEHTIDCNCPAIFSVRETLETPAFYVLLCAVNKLSSRAMLRRRRKTRSHWLKCWRKMDREMAQFSQSGELESVMSG